MFVMNLELIITIYRYLSEFPIFQGPAIEDGRLKIGDRLLEVNNVEMTGKTQSEAVTLLKSLPLGSKVKIVVSRQEDIIENSLPRIIVSISLVVV